MIIEFITAVFMILAAEMGDKTQVLAMMFATRFKKRDVLIGVSIGSLLNHGIAVIIGFLLGNVIDLNIMQTIAGIAFIGFACWTLLAGDEEEEDAEDSTIKKGAIITVATAFFIGELGDKTQLMATTLAMEASYPILLLAGTVTGMVVTSYIGILIGSMLGDKIPEAGIKLVSASLFLIFGVMKLVESTPTAWVNPLTILGFVVLLGIASILLVRTFVTSLRTGALTPYKRAARQLYNYTHQMQVSLNDLCKTENQCGQCQTHACGIWLIRHIIETLEIGDDDHLHQDQIAYIRREAGFFDRERLEGIYTTSMHFLQQANEDERAYHEVDTIRKVIEVLLYGDYSEDMKETV